MLQGGSHIGSRSYLLVCLSDSPPKEAVAMAQSMETEKYEALGVIGSVALSPLDLSHGANKLQVKDPLESFERLEELPTAM